MNRRELFQSVFAAVALLYCPRILRDAVAWRTPLVLGVHKDFERLYADAVMAWRRFKDERGRLLRDAGWPGHDSDELT